ncbi:twin-arginine translocation pathway signal [Advenella kashmirensis W13003]|uniref:Twin-arginine translocation pathway signal n=1 Tax=Advenella kashmirensis W13003 TaxID=1424334 RepID=V8QSR8_9BURK|nr:tripartite tricarboxylate transporter substrate binding protein [Advenella kashmirensis]ETF03006.1 twin-arginine translocation pathway signal [Advenella kashmirensis W13003]
MKPFFLKHSLLGVILCAWLGLMNVPANAANTWPERPIRLVLPFSAGGPADTVTRLIAQGLSRQLNQPVVVENKPGAGGIIGSALVAKSKPDGYTLLVAGNGSITNVLLRSKMPYEDADLVPVASTHTSPSVIVASVTSDFTNLTELRDSAKRKGGLNFGTAGAGSTGHFVAEMIQEVLGVPITLVHYKSGSETINALMSGQIDLASEAPVGVSGYVAGGKLRALAVTAGERSSFLPDVPTTAEQGFSAISMQHWGGIYAPKGTPTNILNHVVSALLAASEEDNAALRTKLEAMGNEPMMGSRQDFERFIASEKERLGKLIRKSNMKLD